VVDRLAADSRRRERDAEVLDDARLTDEFVERARPELDLRFVRPIQNGKAALARHSVPASLGPLPRGLGDRSRRSPRDARNVSVVAARGKEGEAGEIPSESAPTRDEAGEWGTSGAAAGILAR
jgi:hypothetical protein